MTCAQKTSAFERSEVALSSGLVLLLATAAGLSVATLYYG